MKITAILLLTTALQISAKTYSQKVTLSVKNERLEKVFAVIKKQTGFSFLYTREMLKEAKTVTMEVTDAPLQKVLEDCFNGQPLTFSILNNTVVVKLRPVELVPANTVEELAPPITVIGKVTDEDGNPLMGATVKVKGSTTLITMTNVEGFFVLKGVVDSKATLEISFVGFLKQDYPLGGRTTTGVVQLKRAEGILDAVVVRPYWKQTKRFDVGNAATVTAVDIEKQPVTNPLLALQGRVPGLEIIQNSGLSGGSVTVRIQGQNSISNGNEPFYVIDGVPYPSRMMSTTTGAGILNSPDNGGGNPLNYINPNDIESIEILKDADATAIYGSRAANGAILITTKKGKGGKMKVDVNLQEGWSHVNKFFDLMNTEQYIMMRKEAFKNDGLTAGQTDYDVNGLWDTTRYTNWQKVLIGNTAHFTNGSIGISGGTNNINYRVTGTYNRTTTVFPGNFHNKNAGLSFNLNTTSANQKFRMLFSTNYMVSTNALPTRDIAEQANQLAPNAPALYNSDGTLNWQTNAAGSSSWTNPLSILESLYDNNTNNLIASSTISYKILSGLEFKSTLGYNQLQTNEFYAQLLASYAPESIPIISQNQTASITNSLIKSWIVEPQLTYQNKLFSGRLDCLIGTTLQRNNNNGEYIFASGLANDQVLRNISSASSINVNSVVSEYRYAAIFGRLNYNLKDKYLMNLTIRRDGSSRFGPANRYHNFGALGAGWIFSKEKWASEFLSWLSFGKLKASYGTTGSDQIGDYSYLSLYPSVSGLLGYQGVVGVTAGVYNPYLEWEETKKIQTGIELGFIKDRFLLTAYYAKNTSSNQLLDYTLPIMTGFGSVKTNFPATVQNTSWEFSLNSVNIKTKNFTWSSNLNLTIPRNKLLAFPNLATSPYGTTLIIGAPLTAVRTYNFAGVNPSTGQFMVYDQFGNPTSNPSRATDATFLINGTTWAYGGLENKIKFKGFQIDFLFQFRFKQDALYYRNGAGRFNSGFGNQPTENLNRWQQPGDQTIVQRFSTLSLPNTVGNRNITDIWFLKLRTLSISYQMKERFCEKLRLQSSSIFLHTQNLWTIATNYKGLDPELGGRTGLPPLRMITLGINVNL